MSSLAKCFLVFYILIHYVYAGIIPSIDIKETKKLVDNKKAIIIDVREPIEMKNGVVKGSMLLPLSKMNEERIAFDQQVDSMPKNKMLIVYCASGRRAEIVGAELEKKGYKVFNMGKFTSWRDAGFPVEIKE